LEEQFRDEPGGSVYAEEGTAAHALAEHKLKKALKRRSKRPVSVHHGGWWAPIFVFFNAAEKMAIGGKIVLSGKSILSRCAKVRGFRDSIWQKGKRV
jgi:hypothetical protein